MNPFTYIWNYLYPKNEAYHEVICNDDKKSMNPSTEASLSEIIIDSFEYSIKTDSLTASQVMEIINENKEEKVSYTKEIGKEMSKFGFRKKMVKIDKHNRILVFTHITRKKLVEIDEPKMCIDDIVKKTFEHSTANEDSITLQDVSYKINEVSDCCYSEVLITKTMIAHGYRFAKKPKTNKKRFTNIKMS